MKNNVTVRWDEEMSFTADVNDFQIKLDAHESVGGQNKGPRPKALTLASLGGCTGMDVVSILKKMRVDFDSFSMDIEADLTTEHPKIYSKIHLIYQFSGEDLPMDKLERAVELSQENYCGVSAMLKESSEITYEIRLV